MRLIERFSAILRDRALIPEPALARCEAEAARTTGRTNFPLVELLVEQGLLEPAAAGALLRELGIHTLECPSCKSRSGLQLALGRFEPSFTCDGCATPVTFVELGEDTGGVEGWQSAATIRIAPDSSAPNDHLANIPTILQGPPPGVAERDISGPTLNVKLPAWLDQATPGAGVGPGSPTRIAGVPMPPPPNLSGPPPAGAGGPRVTVGEVIDGRYEVQEPLRDFGGVVYKALERGLDRPVALKILHREQDTTDRLVRDIEAIGKLSHPNIITILNVGHIGDREYFVLEYVEGDTLARRLRDEGRLEPAEATRVCRDLADALQHAHGRGLIHGAFSPSSVRMDPSGHPYVIDLCLAPAGGAGDAVAYRAPEVRAGGRADVRSDVYSLGAVFYESLTGERAGDPLTHPATHDPALPESLCALCLRALDPDPEARHESISELRRAFDLAVESVKIGAGAAGGRSGRRTVMVAVVLLLSVLLIGGAWAYFPGAVGSWIADARDGAGGGKTPSKGAPETGDGDRTRPVQPDTPWASQLAEAKKLYGEGLWIEALRQLEAAEARGAKLAGGPLESLRDELTVYQKARGMVQTPDALVRYLVRHGGQHAKSPALLKLAADNELWLLDLNTDPAGATVMLHPVDSLTGTIDRKPERQLDLGTTPVVFPFVNKAVYQVVVRGKNDGVSRVIEFPVEFRKDILESADKPREKRVRITFSDLRPGMSLVPAASGAAMVQESGADRDFLVDQLETTNESFARFCREVNAARPGLWPNGAMPTGSGRLPVVGVGFSSALYYALWSGKRLPTKVEWHKAAGGQDNREYPWGGAFNQALAVTGEAGATAPQVVGTRPGGASPYGAQDMAGNVAEIVIPTNPAQRGQVLYLGGSWRGRSRDATISSSTPRVSRNAERWFDDVGLRCVKSLLLAADGSELSVERALEDPYPGVVIEALYQLSRSGSGAWDKIFAQLGSRLELVPVAARFYLMRGELAKLQPYLEAKLASPDALQRLHTVQAISTGLQPNLLPLMDKVARDPDPRVREVVYGYLCNRALTAGRVPLFLAGLEDTQPRIRTWSLGALAGFRSAQTLAAVRGLLGDEDPQVAYGAAMLLIGWREMGAAADIVKVTLALVQPQLRYGLQSRLGLLGPDAVIAAAAPTLASATPAARARAVELMGAMGAVEHIDKMIASLKAQDPVLLQAGITSLVSLANRQALEVLSKTLVQAGVPPQLRSLITTRLSWLGYEPAAAPFIALINRRDVSAQERGQLLISLGRLGGKAARDFLFAAMTTPNHPLSQAPQLMQAFAMSGHPQAAALLSQRRDNAAADQKALLTILLGIAGHQPVKRALLSMLQARQRIDRETQNYAIGLSGVLTAGEVATLLASRRATDRMAARITLLLSRHIKVDAARVGPTLLRLPAAEQLQIISAFRNSTPVSLLPYIEQLSRSTADGRVRGAAQSLASQLAARKRVLARETQPPR